MARPSAIAVLLAGCVEYHLSGRDDLLDGGSAGASAGLGGVFEDGGTSVPCGDGDALPDAVAADDSCRGEVEEGPLDAVVEWEKDPFLGGYAEYRQLLMAPAVGVLRDDDGDGDLDADDVPDIVVVSDDGGADPLHVGILRVIDGDGDGPDASYMRFDAGDGQVFPYRYTNVALGDVDGDGLPDIVFTALFVGGGGGGDTGGEDPEDTAPPPGDTGGEGDTGAPDDHPVRRSLGLPAEDGGDEDLEPCTLAAVTPDGTLLWVASELQVDCGGHAPALADLEGDGEVEVVLGPWIVEGATGAVRAVGEADEGRFFAYPEIGMHSVVADVDLDGVQEVAAGGTLYAPDGSVECRSEEAGDGFDAVADLDGDGLGEIVIVGGGSVSVMEHDCTLAARWSLGGEGNGGPPTIGDFDGDGEPEIGVAAADAYSTWEADGTPLWSAPVTDGSSHATGSVLFDFEGDGRPEVVYADETRLWVFDGATGAVRLEDDRHASRTLHDYPTIADVDADGHAEIVVANGGGHLGEDREGLYVLGGADDSWINARRLWNQHAYAIVNVEDDLSIPATPEPNWPDHNNFRSGDVVPGSDGALADAVPLAELCELDCGRGVHHLVVRVGNAGAATLRDGVPVSVYTGDGALIATGEVSGTVAPGAVGEPVAFEIADEDVRGDVLVVVADDDGSGGPGWVRECDEDDNVLVLEDVECPAP